MYNLLKIVMKRRLFASKEIIVLVKHCLLVRKLIEVLGEFPREWRMRFYGVLGNVEENHYNSPFTESQVREEVNGIYREIGKYGEGEEVGDEFDVFNYPFEPAKETSPLFLLYLSDLLNTNFLSTLQ